VIRDPNPTLRGVGNPNLQNNLVRCIAPSPRTALMGIDDSDTRAAVTTVTGPSNAFDGQNDHPASRPDHLLRFGIEISFLPGSGAQPGRACRVLPCRRLAEFLQRPRAVTCSCA